jgi:hypothetical protein
MREVRFSIDYTDAAAAGRARLSVCRFEDGMIGYGVMKPMLFQQFLETETPDGSVVAMTDIWSQGETKAFLQAALDCAWKLGLRPAAAKPTGAPNYALAEVSPAIAAHAEELRLRALSAHAPDEALAA